MYLFQNASRIIKMVTSVELSQCHIFGIFNVNFGRSTDYFSPFQGLNRFSALLHSQTKYSNTIMRTAC